MSVPRAMIRSRFPAFACVLLAGCVTNTLSTQNAQLTPVGAGAAVAARTTVPAQRPAPSPTPTARLASAALVTTNKVTTAGATLTLATPQSLGRDCTPLGPVKVKVTEAPDHGTVHVENGTAFSNFVPGDPPYLCNARRTSATVVTYQAEAGFSGQDVAVIEVFFPDGKAPTLRFNITVR